MFLSAGRAGRDTGQCWLWPPGSAKLGFGHLPGKRDPAWLAYDANLPHAMAPALLEHVYTWLSPSDALCRADLIFALAGRESRKHFALELFQRRMAETLLLSVGRFEIRRFARLPWPTELDLLPIASRTPAPLRHYFVGFEAGNTRVELVPRGQFGTLSEIRALSEWLHKRPQIGSLLVISSAPHLRRVRLCCRALLAKHLKIHFIAAPNDALTPEAWWHESRSRADVLKEIPKLLTYKLLLTFCRF